LIFTKFPKCFSLYTYKYLNKLRSGQFQECGLGLGGASSSHQSLSGARRSVQENSLWRLDADVHELFFVRHRQHDSLDQLLDLLVQTADIGILLSWSEIQISLLHEFVNTKK
jgi:hypothetical protein